MAALVNLTVTLATVLGLSATPGATCTIRRPSCVCEDSPLCRHHHRCKQAEGWHLEQPEPGILRWRTPAGRTYTTTPTEYPV